MTITTFWFVFWLVITFILGGVAGTFLSRFTLKRYFQDNPPITEEMIENMLRSMGQPASKKRVTQIVNNMKNSSSKNKK